MTQQTDLQSIPAESLNLTEHHIEQLKQLFPNVFTEGKIDFDALKSELGEFVETESERYQFTWAGKEQAKRISTTPSLGTLRPAPDESVNWDSTENLYIEGDNLEVLKLLQKSYFGKVKMIYIDPPYNTGKDFVYKDDFKDNLANYQRLTGQKDDQGNPLTTNSESAGRYHSNWLNMMYPRLKLARNLLRDDGVIFISIDDNEVHNLRKICDEIFGEGNFAADLVWKKKQGGGNDSNHIVVEHEHVFVVSKSTNNLKLYLDKNYKLDDALYPFKDEKGEYGLVTLDKSSIRFSDSLVFEIKDGEGNIYLPRVVKGKQACWRWGKEKVSRDYEQLVFKDGKVYTKYYRPDGVTPKSLLVDAYYGRTETGNDDIKAVFEEQRPFSYPKPVVLLKHLISIGLSQDDIVLDFFSGSATTAHAVMQLNAEDGGNRKFILVQIPEHTPENSEARKAGYATIAEIGKERIRRAANKIKQEHPDTQADLGFKVLKLDRSNIKMWKPKPGASEQEMIDYLNQAVDNIVDGRTAEDLLYEVLIKYGLPLTLPIQKIDINSNGQTYQAWSVAHNSLVACFDENITLETVQAIANLSTPENPVLRVVFRDTSFTDDITKTNAIQRLKQTGIEDVLSI